MKKIFIYALALIHLCGCVSKPVMSFEELDTAYSEYILDQNLSSEERIGGFRFGSWSSLSDGYLILEANYRKYYLINTKGRCFGLRNSKGIKVHSSSSLSLRINQDSISTFEDKNRKCVIKSIFPITNSQANELISIGKEPKNES